MSNGIVRVVRPVFRSGVAAMALAALAALAAWPNVGRAQAQPEPLLKVEVGDSIGLPLPDARLELFTFMEGAVFWEWVQVSPEQLSPGVHLLRFSHPGYRTTTFSVPLQKKSQVSLRVRLGSERDTTKRLPIGDTQAITAIGLAIEGRAKSDVIGHRWLIERDVIALETTGRFGALLSRARGTDLNFVPASGGTYVPLRQTQSGRRYCAMNVMLNGDRRHVLSFSDFDALYTTHDVEAIEVFSRLHTLPLAYQLPRRGCGLLVVWSKSP